MPCLSLGIDLTPPSIPGGFTLGVGVTAVLPGAAGELCCAFDFPPTSLPDVSLGIPAPVLMGLAAALKVIADSLHPIFELLDAITLSCPLE